MLCTYSSSSLGDAAAEHSCGRHCGCGFALQPFAQHGACEPLPALAELLRCGQHGGECGADNAEHWLPELPDGMDLPASGADPLEAMLAELSGPDERFGEVDAGAQPAGSAATSPARHRAAEPAAWGSPSVTTASDQTHASPGFQPGHASADGGTTSSSAAAYEPAHSSDGVHSAAAKAMPMAAASARESSPSCETSQQAAQRSSSGSASPSASDSEFSGPKSRQQAAPASADASGAEGSPRSDAFHSDASPAAAAAPSPQQPTLAPAPQQWPPFQAALQQPAWQQQQLAQQQPTSSGNTPSAYTLGSPPQEEAQRAALKVARNRESAQQSRQRKRAAGDEVQRRCDELQSHNGQLAGVVQRLTAENAVLRHQLLAVCAATGATPPMPVHPPAFAAGAVAAPPPQAVPLAAAPKVSNVACCVLQTH
jgi:bZIP transcription factor